MGDASKAASKLGWKAKTTFDELVSEMLEADCRAYGIMLASGENTDGVAGRCICRGGHPHCQARPLGRHPLRSGR
ncbi:MULTISPECIES: hypothetical protein [unclassified Mesorhizobium]|uniref:hypothetical protein n=1 Tax=unclassified Mesorhizobium TaxID=325217 RepID=UPI001FDF948A|nr:MULTISPECIES: hypothetical protein [unclassified Mesorhizobium]